MAGLISEDVPAMPGSVTMLKRTGAFRFKQGEGGSFSEVQCSKFQKQEDPEVVKSDVCSEKIPEQLCQSPENDSTDASISQPAVVSDSPVVCRKEEPLNAGVPGPCEPESPDVDGVMCDSCIEVPRQALKSCLTCQVSYCQEHLRPHLESARFQKHRLVEPLSDFEGPTCNDHQRPLDLYCQEDGCCICRTCTDEDHHGHHVVPIEEAHRQMEKELQQKQVEVVKVVTSAENALIKLQNNILSMKSSMADAFTVIDQQFSELKTVVVKVHMNIRNTLEEDERKVMRRAEGIRGHLEHKCADLKRIQVQMDTMSRNTNHMAFIQEYLQWKTVSLDFTLPGVYLSLTDRLATLTGVVVKSTQELCEKLPSMYKEKLNETHKREKLAMKTLTTAIDTVQSLPSEPEPQNRLDFLKYSTPLTFDPNTTHKFLRLTKENVKVTNTTPWQHSYPDSSERFEHWRQVLAAKTFYRGRHYFEVEAKGESPHMGLTCKSINRKTEENEGCITGNDFSWCLQWRSDGFSVWHADVEKPLVASKFARVGVYVDFDGGLLAFYGVDDHMTLIHQYRAEFLDPLQLAVWLPKKESAVLLVSATEAPPIEGSPLMSPPSTQTPSLVPLPPSQ